MYLIRWKLSSWVTRSWLNVTPSNKDGYILLSRVNIRFLAQIRGINCEKSVRETARYARRPKRHASVVWFASAHDTYGVMERRGQAIKFQFNKGTGGMSTPRRSFISTGLESRACDRAASGMVCVHVRTFNGCVSQPRDESITAPRKAIANAGIRCSTTDG